MDKGKVRGAIRNSTREISTCVQRTFSRCAKISPLWPLVIASNRYRDRCAIRRLASPRLARFAMPTCHVDDIDVLTCVCVCPTSRVSQLGCIDGLAVGGFAAAR